MNNNTRIQAADIFLRAAGYIRRYGWQKEGMGEYGQPRCSMGALESAHPIIEWDRNLAQIMYGGLCEELAGISLTSFNARSDDGEAVARLFERTSIRLMPR